MKTVPRRHEQLKKGVKLDRFLTFAAACISSLNNCAVWPVDGNYCIGLTQTKSTKQSEIISIRQNCYIKSDLHNVTGPIFLTNVEIWFRSRLFSGIWTSPFLLFLLSITCKTIFRSKRLSTGNSNLMVSINSGLASFFTTLVKISWWWPGRRNNWTKVSDLFLRFYKLIVTKDKKIISRHSHHALNDGYEEGALAVSNLKFYLSRHSFILQHNPFMFISIWSDNN